MLKSFSLSERMKKMIPPFLLYIRKFKSSYFWYPNKKKNSFYWDSTKCTKNETINIQKKVYSERYRYVMAEIPQFVYFLTTKPQNCTPAKKTNGISFTCDVRFCTVNISQSLTNTNSTLPYLRYFLIKYCWNQRYGTEPYMKKSLR